MWGASRHYSKADPLYGSPRGNAVMKAKRVTGDSARTILLRHIALERCSTAGCSNPPIRTKNRTAINKERKCLDCIGIAVENLEGKVADITALLAMPTRNGG